MSNTFIINKVLIFDEEVVNLSNVKVISICFTTEYGKYF
ncbi:MAG: hypothetical protein PWR06_2559 [Thermoanaerobacteraceae bacterium]|jgi:hypothetical protein|nr:hypothetical protein [Thermoanaerobacteraceae bacterium]MDN5302849.1 hypothetical protein [Thermoanaerobacteraceae bacterium]